MTRSLLFRRLNQRLLQFDLSLQIEKILRLVPVVVVAAVEHRAL